MGMAVQHQWHEYSKILCIRTDNLGDVLMTEPALRSLKRGASNRQIHLLTSSTGSTAARLIGSIDKIMVCDAPWISNKSTPNELPDLISKLKHEAYDGAVIFTVYSQSPLPAAMICYMAGIVNVASYCRENPYKLISTWIPDDEPLFRIRHEVTRQLDLANHLGGARLSKKIKINIHPEVVENLKQKLHTITTAPFILVHPGVSEKRRQFPWELYAEAIDLIRTDIGMDVLLTGSESEIALAEKIAGVCGSGVLSVAGMFSLHEFAALISLSPLLIANNSGPVHLAAATGTPVVVLYAQTNPQHTPWMVDHVLLPFDVPECHRSKNTIVQFAHEKSFNPVNMIEPRKIADAAKLLLYRKQKQQQVFKQ
jgi:ADP-heptose:LPS heptosyltransferase